MRTCHATPHVARSARILERLRHTAQSAAPLQHRNPPNSIRPENALDQPQEACAEEPGAAGDRATSNAPIPRRGMRRASLGRNCESAAVRASSRASLLPSSGSRIHVAPLLTVLVASLGWRRFTEVVPRRIASPAADRRCVLFCDRVGASRRGAWGQSEKRFAETAINFDVQSENSSL
jgi:hypothetical protein